MLENINKFKQHCLIMLICMPTAIVIVIIIKILISTIAEIANKVNKEKIVEKKEVINATAEVRE